MSKYLTADPICDDPDVADIYLWHISIGGCDLVINHDRQDRLNVLTGYAGCSSLDLEQVDSLHQALTSIRMWMHAHAVVPDTTSPEEHRQIYADNFGDDEDTRSS